MKRLLPLLFFLFAILQLSAQSKYWILLNDKPRVEQPALSEKAWERRAHQAIPLDEKDFPVSAGYLCHLAEKGVIVQQKSRWLNAVSAILSKQQAAEVLALPFVRDIRPVARMQMTSLSSCDPTADYDNHRAQLSQIGLDDLHAQGFRGAGLRIAVLDNGFSGVDTLPPFQHVWKRNGFLYEEDLVEKGTSLYGPCRGSCKHGVHVLSLLAARWPGSLMGAAPDADYLLFRTENDLSETHQEEDNWLAAAEKADSLGADIILSSLTYLDFDPGEGDYTDADLDGQTAIVTLAAEIAASKGILVVNSVGNYGTQGIAPPADGPSVLAIGSVTQEGLLSSFSSRGPTFDGRIKPDLVARGDQAYLLFSDGKLQPGSGTSYSAPLVAGLAACLWQADQQQHNAAEMRDILRQSGDRYDNPNNDFGYGLPQAAQAYEALTGESLTCFPSFSESDSDVAKIYPNPASQEFSLALGQLRDGQKLRIVMMDLTGKIVVHFSHTYQAEFDRLYFSGNWNPGYYILRITDDRGGFFFSGKVVIVK